MSELVLSLEYLYEQVRVLEDRMNDTPVQKDEPVVCVWEHTSEHTGAPDCVEGHYGIDHKKPHTYCPYCGKVIKREGRFWKGAK